MSGHPASDDDADDDEEEESSTDPIKLAVVVRKDLHMTSGKLAAQVGHAVHQVMVEGKRNKLKAWDDDGGMIVVLQVLGGADLKQLKAAAKKAGLAWTMVVDEGLTEVQNGSSTVLAVGPDDAEKVNTVTGHLQLYKSVAEEEVIALRSRLEAAERRHTAQAGELICRDVGSSDAEQPTVPDLHELWTWEGDESCLPSKWQDTLELAYSASDIATPEVKPWTLPDFDREGTFFITSRSDTCGVAAVSTTGKLLVFAVAPAHRRKGIGRCLVKLCKYRQAQLGKKQLTCAMDPKQHPVAWNLLCSEGFQQL